MEVPISTPTLNPYEGKDDIDKLREKNDKIKDEINKMKNEQLPKDIEFNNLYDDYNNANEECDKLKD